VFYGFAKFFKVSIANSTTVTFYKGIILKLREKSRKFSTGIKLLSNVGWKKTEKIVEKSGRFIFSFLSLYNFSPFVPQSGTTEDKASALATRR